MFQSSAKQGKESLLDYTMESTDYTNFKTRAGDDNKFKTSGGGFSRHS